MKRIIYSLFIALAVCSCDDFLNQEPQDFGNEDSYFRTPSDLEMSANAFYEKLPCNNTLWGGIYSLDITSDNQCSFSAQNLFYPGNKLTVAISSSEWNFQNLRGINFFINKTRQSMANGNLSGKEEAINHYLGEGYFFRAYDYFRLLRNFGDVPILTQMMTDDVTSLVASSKRAPRNMVARFILADLDTAASLLMSKAPESGRICRDAALALKSRVALYEASWERYHAGTCFVPGNDKWPGNTTWQDFTFPAGSAEAEVNFFLDQAIEASVEPSENRSLAEDYAAMFNNWKSEFADDSEVILARYYKAGILSHSCSAFLGNGGNCNATRALVNSYLMLNGMPIYAETSGYRGDKSGYDEMQGRDDRLTQSVRFPGCVTEEHTAEDGTAIVDTLYYFRPRITTSGNNGSPTGYELSKWVSTDVTQRTQYLCTTAVPLFRSAECRLNYIEAYYMRHGSLDNRADSYWRELRRRAGVDEDYKKTIAATDLSKENDLAVWSKGTPVDATLYNIRRERRCELFAEGLRLDDLKRWRALDIMVNYQPEGINLWGGANRLLWGEDLEESTMVSKKDVSDYMRPLQVSTTSIVYNGYNFPKQHYLEPVPLSEFRFDGASASGLYQNPGWPVSSDGPADYSFNCD